MIGIDVSPLHVQPRTGVARALSELLKGFDRLEPPPPFVLLPPDAPASGTGSAALRRAMGAHVAAQGVTVFYSPWSAFPRLSVPTVVLVHELPFAVHGPMEGRLRTWRHRVWLRRDARRCAAIVVPSESTRAQVLALHPEAAARVHVIPNGFDPAPWEAARAAPAEPPYGVMVGVGSTRRAGAKKGLDIVLEAWRQAGPAVGSLHLVGAPPWPVPEHVVVHRDCPDEALRALVAGARLLVYPSRAEGFGYPPLEAMAAGVPVVTTDAGAIPAVVGDAAHVVPAGDVGALAAGIEAVSTDEALRAGLVARGRARARAFPCAESAAQLVDLLHAVEAGA